MTPGFGWPTPTCFQFKGKSWVHISPTASRETMLQDHFCLDVSQTLDHILAAHAGTLHDKRCASCRIESWGQVGMVVSKTSSKPTTEQYGNVHGRTWSKVATSVPVVGRGLRF